MFYINKFLVFNLVDFVIDKLSFWGLMEYYLGFFGNVINR